MIQCVLCEKRSVGTILDFGLQPISNRFLSSQNSEELRHPLILGHCPSCDLAQLINPVSAKELMPRYEWISYNEPEGHLDDLVSVLAELPKIKLSSLIGGISFKDDTTVERFKTLGFQSCWRIDQTADLGIRNNGAGVETVQDVLSPAVAKKIASKYGRTDILIVRHILEHVQDIKGFVASLKALTSPDGYIVFEVPDCDRAFANNDYTTLWEEHRLYFTPNSLKRFCDVCGFKVVRSLCYPYAFENSLVVIVNVNSSAPLNRLPTDQMKKLYSYADGFHKLRQDVIAFLEDFTSRSGPVALFGAGHLACTYVNLLGISEFVRFIVDDNRHKRGLFMPGSRLPIVGSKALIEQNIKLCLLCLNPEIEDRVIEKNREFVDSGGVFASIFPESRHAFAHLKRG